MPRRVSNQCDFTGQKGKVAVQSNTTAVPAEMPLPDQVQLVVRHWADAPEHTEQTRVRMSETVTRFSRRADAGGISQLSAVRTADARGFVLAPTQSGATPELATQHARRTAVRTLFRTARLLGLATGDPTLDLVLPSRGTLAARPH
jgi:hypothetical protein